MTRARFSGGVPRHAGNAFCADSTARATVALSASSTRFVAAPVAGSKTSCDRPPSETTFFPSIQ